MNTNRLKALRALLPASTQAHFASLTGISVSLLQQLEKAEDRAIAKGGPKKQRSARLVLTSEVANRISLATGICPQWLMGAGDPECPVSRFGGTYDSGAAISIDDVPDPFGLALKLTDEAELVGAWFLQRLEPHVQEALKRFRCAWQEEVWLTKRNLLGRGGMERLLSRLRKPASDDEWAMRVRVRLLPTTRAGLDECVETPDGDLERSMVNDLDRLLRGPELPLHAAPPKGWKPQPSRSRRNLMALCAAFPDCLQMDKDMEPVHVASRLVEGFSECLGGGVLHDEGSFRRVELRSETKRLLYQNPTGLDRCRLNRLLLEDAFRGFISRDHARGFREWNRLTDCLEQRSASGGDAMAYHTQALGRSLDLLLRGALRAGSSKAFAVGRVVALQLHETAVQFGLVPYIEGHARDRGMRSTDLAPFLHGEDLQADAEMRWLFLGEASRESQQTRAGGKG